MALGIKLIKYSKVEEWDTLKTTIGAEIPGEDHNHWRNLNSTLSFTYYSEHQKYPVWKDIWRIESFEIIAGSGVLHIV